MADRDTPQHVPGGGQQPSLAYYAIAFMGLATVFIVGAMMAASFWLSRPVNYSPETDRLADALQMALLDNFVPAANIERAPAVPQSAEREDTLTRWTFHEFTVALPPELRTDGVKAQLRKQMSEHYVQLVDGEQGSGSNGNVLSLSYENLPFARLTLAPAAGGTATASRSDLRHNSSLLADLVAEELGSLNTPVPIARDEAQEREDLNAVWRYTPLAATLPRGMSLGDLKGSLQARNTIPDVVFSTDPNLGQGIDLLATIAGKPAVGLSLSLSPQAPASRPEPVSLSGMLDNGIDGSEPSEESLDTVEGAEMPPEDAPEVAGDAMIETPVNFPAIAPAEPEPSAPSEPATPPPAPSAPSAPPEPAAPPLEPVRADTPRNSGPPAQLAIIIDDGGNSKSHADRFLTLDNRLTLAILPNTPYAVDTAERGAALGFEIMLHMPMETDSASEEAVEGTLFTAMGEREIKKLTKAALDQIPYVSGMNNHTGSKFTSNEMKMGYCLEVLEQRGLFFVDSVTSHRSAAYATAVEMGIPAARRDVFLDNEHNEASIRAQFEVLKKAALDNGLAIGIGHFQSQPTATVLAQEIPKLEAANILLVHASELVR